MHTIELPISCRTAKRISNAVDAIDAIVTSIITSIVLYIFRTIVVVMIVLSEPDETIWKAVVYGVKWWEDHGIRFKCRQDIDASASGEHSSAGGECDE